MKTKRPKVVFLIETKCGRRKVEEVRNLMGYDSSFIAESHYKQKQHLQLLLFLAIKLLSQKNYFNISKKSLCQFGKSSKKFTIFGNFLFAENDMAANSPFGNSDVVIITYWLLHFVVTTEISGFHLLQQLISHFNKL